MPKVLIVEDDEDTRELVAERLRDQGYEVAEAENGADALQKLEHMKDDPCLVLLDCVMPVMTGPEFLAILREGHRIAPLPVVVMSGTAASKDVPDAQRFIKKPAEFRVLLKVVEEFCGRPSVAPSSGFSAG